MRPLSLSLLALASCRLLSGPELCGDRAEYSCEGDVLVFCESDDSPIVKVDCAAQELQCNDVAQTCSLCGNEIEEPGEVCDDGNDVDGDGCGETCLDTAECGNGEVEANEQCDDGDAPNGCADDCTLGGGVECGDGDIAGGEQCDDGNTESGDGCSATCQAEEILNCSTLDAAGLINAPDNSVLLLEGSCDLGLVEFNNKRLTLRAGPAGATFSGTTTLSIIGGSKIIFDGINFNVNANILKIITTNNTSQTAILNATLRSEATGGGTRYIECVGDALFLLDQVTIPEHRVDRAIKTDNNCQLILANSVIRDSRQGSKDVFELKKTSKAGAFFSTFFRNSNSSEEGIAQIDTPSSFILNSLAGVDNGGNPITGVASPLSEANFIKDFTPVNTLINDDVDPKLDPATAKPAADSPLIGQGDPTPNLGGLFDPIAIFGINIFAHDREGLPRAASPNAGAFEAIIP